MEKLCIVLYYDLHYFLNILLKKYVSMRLVHNHVSTFIFY